VKRRCIDYFAGAGGFTLGATDAGAEVVEAINHWPLAVKVHATNHPSVIHRCEDLTRFNPRRLSPVEGLVASSACQGFTEARGVAEGSPEDARWDDARATSWSIIDFAELCAPAWIAAENVLAWRRWKLFPSWLDALSRLGYATRVQVCDAALWGVPQHRPRVIVTAIRGRREAPAVEPPRGVVLAPIGDVIRWDEGAWNPVAEKVEATRARVARGRAAFGRRFVMPYNGSGSGLTGRSLDRPLGTVTAADRWGVVDGDHMRMLTVAELTAAMDFPAGYALPPKREDATKMLGNAIVRRVAAAAVRACLEAA
jgi:DNA (cytosine-5)-methyltransferase 1